MLQNSFKKHFVFDLDDTLINGRTFCGETIARVIAKYLPDVNQTLIIKLHDELKGAAIGDIYKEIITSLKLDINFEQEITNLLKYDAEIQIAEAGRIELFDGAIDILDFLKKSGKKVHICTNRPRSSLDIFLNQLKITNYFDTIVSCADAGYKKPNPKCLLDLINENGNTKDDFIYFGDSVTDSEFAKNSGIDFIIFDQYLNEKNLFKKLINMFLEDKINNFPISAPSSASGGK